RFEFPIEGGNGNFYIHITMEVQNATITFVRAALVKSNDNNDINEDWAAITYNATIPSRAEMINSIERIVHSTRMADKLHHLKDQSSLQPGKSLKFRKMSKNPNMDENMERRSRGWGCPTYQDCFSPGNPVPEIKVEEGI